MANAFVKNITHPIPHTEPFPGVYVGDFTDPAGAMAAYARLPSTGTQPGDSLVCFFLNDFHFGSAVVPPLTVTIVPTPTTLPALNT